MSVIDSRIDQLFAFCSIRLHRNLLLLAIGCLLSLGCSPSSTEPSSAAQARNVPEAKGSASTKAPSSPAVAENKPSTSPASSPQGSAKQEASTEEVDDLLYQKTVRAGVEYLLQKGQAEDGSFSNQLSPAVTALCTSALIEHRVPIQDPRIQKSLKYLETVIQPDGGIYAKGSSLRNYETSISLMCFRRANTDGKYDQTIQKALDFLKGIQWDDGEGHSVDSTSYGGQGYGSHQRPDLSNTSFFIDVLKSESEDPESEAFQKAAIFMSRCQNLPSLQNTAAWASKVTDDDRGGFIYTGAGEGESKAGETPEGGLRSYASMTYAGLKSFLYAGIGKDDIRVKAAMDWIGRHYDLTTNPGMGQQGLFYYYHVFAKALEAAGEDTVVDAEGVSHDWRADLTRQLSKLQREDGSWTNPADRWFEGDPNLVTAYALLALSYCDQPAKANTPQ
jgi:squalene-hopene/tetraprenyl-beta-curcumene cyclase